MDGAAYQILCVAYAIAWATVFRRTLARNNYFSFAFISHLAFGIIFIVVPLIPIYEHVRADDAFYWLVLLAYVSYVVAIVVIPGEEATPRRVPLRANKSVLIGIVVLWLGFMAADVIGAMAQQGAWEYITRNRLAARLSEGGVGAGRSIWGLLELVFEPAALIGLLALLRGRQSSWSAGAVVGWALYGLFVLVVLVETNHRTPIVIAFGLGAAFVHYHVRRFTGWMVAGGFAVVLLFLAVSIQLRRGDEAGGAFFDQNIGIAAAAVSGFATVDDFQNLYEAIQREDVDFEYGKNLTYLNLVTFIPRAFWEGKPMTSFNGRMTEEVYGYEPGGGIEYPVRLFTVWGEGYAQFGPGGIVLYSFLFVMLYRALFAFLARYEATELIGVWFLLQMPQIMRAALDSILIQALFTALVVFVVSRALHGRKRKLRPSRVWSDLIS